MFEGEYYRVEMKFINDKYNDKKADLKMSNHRDLYLSKNKKDIRIKHLNEWIQYETRKNIEDNECNNIKLYKQQKTKLKKEYTTRLKDIKSAFKWYVDMLKVSETANMNVIEKDKYNDINIFKKQYYTMKYNQYIDKEPITKHDKNEKLYYQVKYSEYMNIIELNNVINNEKL